MIELRQKPAGTLPDLATMKSSAATISKAGAKVRDATSDLRKLLDPYCPALVTDAKAALAIMQADEIRTA